MPRTITTENPSKDVCRYLKHWGNTAFVEEQLHARHSGLSPEKRRRKTQSAALSILQGLEYFESANGASLLTKPLPLFYAVENIAKAICIIQDPHLEGTDFKDHGLRGDRSRRNSIKNFVCTVKAPGSDVWSRFFRLCNADVIRVALIHDAVPQLRDDRSQYATNPFAQGTQLQLGTLLRHLPELTHDVTMAGWGNPFVVHVAEWDLHMNTGPPPQTSVRFRLRHAHDAPTKAMVVDRETDLLRAYTQSMDALDILEYRLGPIEGQITTPSIRLDVFGQLYMDFARGRAVLGEPVIYLAALFILSDVVRYQVDQWNRLLTDHPAEAILVERLLDLVARKFANLALNELHGQVYLFTIAT